MPKKLSQLEVAIRCVNDCMGMVAGPDSAGEEAWGIVKEAARQSTKESPGTASNTCSIKLPTEMELRKCQLFDECPATNKGHVGCYSTGPCFG